MRVGGLIAAAGSSTRMGACKALLRFSDGVCFVQRLAEVFVAAGLDPVIVTVPDAFADSIARRLEHLSVSTVGNERPAEGLTGSVITALAHAPDAEALVIAPVDCPFADVALVQALLAGLRHGLQRGAPAAVPVVDGKRGHPVVFARPAYEVLWTCGADGGPRAVLDALGDDVVEVPWSDPRVCDDVDTPADYARLFGRKRSPERP